MDEILKGTLYFKGTGKNRKRALKFLTPKNKQWNNEINLNKLSNDLRAAQEDEIKVELRFDKGQPTQVWKTGSPQPDTVGNTAAESTGEQNTNGGDDMKREFHNPYNFVPAPQRNTAHLEFGDHEPCGHDRYSSDKYSGKLCVRMKVVTPLLLPDTARMHIDANEHKSYPVRVDADGKPFINQTAIKGMLRSAYEAVTNSRLSVFKDHDERLAFRMESTEGAKSVPARVERDKIVLYTGTTTIDQEGRPLNTSGLPRNATLCAAWIKTYDRSTCSLDTTNGIILLDARRPAEHGEEVYANIREVPHGSGRFKYWKVEQMALSVSVLVAPIATQIQVKGYVCVTGKNNGTGSGPNTENKHDERLFFNNNASSGFPQFPVADVEDCWDDLIKNYRIEHDNGNGTLRDPPTATRRINGRQQEIPLPWSRHIRNTEKGEALIGKKLKTEALKDKSLLYVRLGRDSANNSVILELYPVVISRRLHKTPPSVLLESTLHPAKLITQLSSADRVFGWVRQAKPKDDELTSAEKQLSRETKEIGAYRGQVRIGVVQCKGINENGAYKQEVIEKFGDVGKTPTWLPLQILGQPKPQQGRFYVAKNKEGNAQRQGLNNEGAGYDLETDKGLRGRKVYPHHANLPDGYWIEESNLKDERGDAKKDLSQDGLKKNEETFFREYIRPKSVKRTNNQNRSTQGWVKRNTEFEFDIHFTNLSDVELGALVWLLTLNKENEEKYFHRFGGGKPLGFGSVRVSLESNDIRKGEDLRTFYQSLDDKSDGKRQPEDVRQLATDFQSLVEKAYPKVIPSFLRACEGFAKPIHYPRARYYRVNNNQVQYITGESAPVPPNPDGLAYEWFVANAKESIKEKGQGGVPLDMMPASEPGQKEIKPRHSLKDLWEDDGLPILPHKKG